MRALLSSSVMLQVQSDSDQRCRYRISQKLLADSVSRPATASCATIPLATGTATPAKSGKDSVSAAVTAASSVTDNGPAANVVPVSAGSGYPAYVPTAAWWDNASSAESSLIEQQDALMSDNEPGADNEGESSTRSRLLGPTGSVPGTKPLPTDPTALGLVVPGCPISATRWKVRVISALAPAMKRGVALGAAWLVESAAKCLWNRHLHVWSANEYSLAVLPLLLATAADALACLAAVGSSSSELCTKLGAAVARAHYWMFALAGHQHRVASRRHSEVLHRYQAHERHMTSLFHSPLSLVTLRDLSRHWRLPVEEKVKKNQVNCETAVHSDVYTPLAGTANFEHINAGQSFIKLYVLPNEVKLEAVLQMTQAEELPGRS